MEIQKIKSWIKNRKQQFIPIEWDLDEIISCQRIKDNKSFVLGLLQGNTLLIKDNTYIIKVSLFYIHEDLTNVDLSAGLYGLHGLVKYTDIIKAIPINELEEWTNAISSVVRGRATMLQEILY